MADLMPRIRRPKVTLPGRSDSASRPRGKEATATEPKPVPEEKAADGAKTAEATTTEAKTTEATKETPRAPTKGTSPEPNLEERMEGLQGWMAEIERKQGRLTYFGLAALVVAILASIAALYFGLAAKNDKASKSDVDALTKKVDALQTAATKNSKETQNALNASAAQLQTSISALQRQQSQNAASIATLQSQASAGAFGKGAAAATTPGAALTPGVPTPATPKKP
jgi:uncharacterized protein YlxW (UPF0749 family)